MKYTWLVIIGVVLLSGCYTQFSTIDHYAETAVEGDTLSENESSDSQTVSSEPDTVVVTERERCYWHRSFWGEPVLRCYKTTYDYNWYSYYSRPWWYRSGMYDYQSRDYGCSCPYHRYYHSNCRYCWERCDRGCYDCDRPSSGRPGGSGGAVSRPPSRSTGSGHTGSGQVIKRGSQKPLIAGPRPDVSNPPSPKKQTNTENNSQQTSQPSSEGSSFSPRDTSRAPAVQPRRHFGRGR